MKTSRILAGALAALGFTFTSAHAQLYIESNSGVNEALAIGEYNYDGSTVSTVIASPAQQSFLGIQGSDLYTLATSYDQQVTTPTLHITQYDGSGTQLSSASITGVAGFANAIVGSDIYIGSPASGGINNETFVGEYTLSGGTVNANLLTIQNTNGGGPSSLAVSGNDLFVAYYNSDLNRAVIGDLNLKTSAFNPDYITLGTNTVAASMTLSQGNLYFDTSNIDGTATIQEYAVSTGSVVNSNLATLQSSGQIAISGNTLYAETMNYSTGIGQVSTYNATTGSLTNGTLVPNLIDPYGVAVGNTAAAVTPTTTTSTLTSGQSYKTVAPVTSTGGLNTTTSLVGGASTGSQTVTLSTTTLADQFKSLASDVVSVSGNAGSVFAVQLTFDLNAANEIGGADAVRLLWLNPSTGKWTNAVNGNTSVDGFTNNSEFYAESFAAFEAEFGITDLTLGNYLGAYGVDTVNDTVWAVIDHNSDFSVANESAPPTAVTPEPSTWALLIGSLGLLAFWRKRVRNS